MFIDLEILLTFGGISKKFKKGEFIFFEGDEARYYFQILEGSVKVYNANSEGKEFTQAEFDSGSSFGEPPLFINENYPSTAVALQDSVILKLSKENLMKILEAMPTLERKFVQLFAQRIFNKASTAKEIINNTPEVRILAFLKAYKKKVNKENEKILIPYTRQEIANFTGLRVETVIRTLSKMKAVNIVDIVDRKLIY